MSQFGHLDLPLLSLFVLMPGTAVISTVCPTSWMHYATMKSPKSAVHFSQAMVQIGELSAWGLDGDTVYAVTDPPGRRAGER